MKEDSTRNGRVWPWKAMVGCVCVSAALVIACGMRGPDNPYGWPQWIGFPALGLDVLAVVLIHADWKAGRL